MRRHVLLIVLLSLAVSLSTEDNTEKFTASPEPTTSISTEDNTEKSTASPEPTTSISTEDNTTTAPAITEPTATISTENNTEKSTASPEPTTSISTEDNTTTAPAITEPTATISTENNTEKSTASPEPTTSISTGDMCSQNPCGTRAAKCVALHSSFICECNYGFYYKDENCLQGKIFPGVIMLNTTYSDDVQNVNSTQYEEMFQNLKKFFEDAFSKLTGFEQTVITKIQSQQEVRASLSTTVTVINLFTQDAEVDNARVTNAIYNATKDSPYVSEYTDAKYCDVYNCDNDTTMCQEKMFPTCECRADFSKTPWDVLSCSDCRKSCSEETHEYCAKDKGVPQCKCKPNFERKDGVCVQCPVGYSGENCNNNSELILIIVGAVLGAVILILVIAVSVVSVRAKHKQNPEKRSLIKSGYSNPNASDERQNTMFPRVQSTSGHVNPGYQPNNPYEIRSANRSHFPEADYSDMYDVSRKPGGFRMQSGY